MTVIAGKKRSRKGWTAAKRKAVSERMKAYWASVRESSESKQPTKGKV